MFPSFINRNTNERAKFDKPQKNKNKKQRNKQKKRGKFNETKENYKTVKPFY